MACPLASRSQRAEGASYFLVGWLRSPPCLCPSRPHLQTTCCSTTGGRWSWKSISLGELLLLLLLHAACCMLLPPPLAVLAPPLQHRRCLLSLERWVAPRRLFLCRCMR